ncbi:trypsin-like peptidase domain-containing protein [Patescibacteria group bacterium]|nr:trypsin-like peptidase domain-containing protein [Patescibacteria group bacterium]MDE1946553.1 trypsin-like peptidase domain-containing protein [Patescibacteria group bacterium]MDE2010886.1 trypsin-like peptidase domain-containing protein [Patescibacteria group bacterium]MDE2232770.1 trypsin-like peptidase domain-containing protein [Patescibacteria group bacterium]
MEHLTKQQIVLVTLLVSFVTALATGVVTVSLMNQAPESVTQTISKVIERTIEAAAPQGAAVATAPNYGDIIANAVEKIASSTVTIIDDQTSSALGSGLIVSKEGVILTDKSVVAEAHKYDVVLNDGTKIPVVIVQSQINGNIVFLAPFPPYTALTEPVTPAAFAGVPKLGQTVYALAGTSSPLLVQGLITSLPGVDQNIGTSISTQNISPGGALFDTGGEIVGMMLAPSDKNGSGGFYPVGTLVGVIPVLMK